MSGLMQSATFLGLSTAILGVAWAGLLVWDRMEDGRRFRDRIGWFLLGMGLLIVGFFLVVEWRCLVGWIDSDECHLLY